MISVCFYSLRDIVTARGSRARFMLCFLLCNLLADVWLFSSCLFQWPSWFCGNDQAANIVLSMVSFFFFLFFFFFYVIHIRKTIRYSSETPVLKKTTQKTRQKLEKGSNQCRIFSEKNNPEDSTEVRKGF